MSLLETGCEYYCIMVVSGQEEKFKAKANELLARNAHQHSAVQFFTKSMKTSKGEPYQEAVFPGYVFLKTDSLDVNTTMALKKNSRILQVPEKQY